MPEHAATRVADRAAKRAEIRAGVFARAEVEAAQIGRSLKCGGQLYPASHAGTEDGCRNDGSTCICECHDGPPDLAEYLTGAGIPRVTLEQEQASADQSGERL